MNETKTNETYKELTVMEWAEQFKPVANTLREDADIKGYDKNHPERGILFCCDEYANGKNETKHVEDAVKLMPDKVWSFLFTHFTHIITHFTQNLAIFRIISQTTTSPKCWGFFAFP